MSSLTLNKVRLIAKQNNGKVTKREHYILDSRNVYDVHTARGTYVGTYYPNAKKGGFTEFYFSSRASKYVVEKFPSTSIVRAFIGLNTEGK